MSEDDIVQSSDRTAIIPIELDALPVPIRIVSEAQKKYSVDQQFIARIVNEYNVGNISLPRAIDLICKIQKDAREWIGLIKELTLDTQTNFEQQAADMLIQLSRDDPQLRKRLGEEAARRYLEQRQVQEIVLDPPTDNKTT